ncbi:MAG TPA: hypothetical protein PKB15_03865 [Acidimicrobiia bacterium]|nr:hypothetical protein [Acidimicrobiia bacterium]
MQLNNCPYDASETTVESYEGGVYLIACSCCGAQWESDNCWVARVTEPDWDIVSRFQEIQNLQSTLD